MRMIELEYRFTFNKEELMSLKKLIGSISDVEMKQKEMNNYEISVIHNFYDEIPELRD